MPWTPARTPARARLADLARSTRCYDLIEPVHSAVRRASWRRAGRPVPPPSAVKRATLRGYGRRYGLGTLVETGTFKGDTVRCLRRDFDRIYSIEVDETLHRQASRRCRWQRNAVLLRGDSADLLPAVLDQLDRPALFWLDAHCSGAGTGTGPLETPILGELHAILSRSGQRHVVLVDDHREFARGQLDYPSEQAVRDLARSAGYHVEVRDDILRLVPAGRIEVG
jgi:hypothetical protein